MTGITYPAPDSILKHLAELNRIARAPAIAGLAQRAMQRLALSAATKNAFLLGAAIVLYPTAAGANSDMAPLTILSSGQMDWAEAVGQGLGIPASHLQQFMANAQRELGSALGLEQSSRLAEATLQQQLEFQGMPTPEAQAEAKRRVDELLGKPEPEPEKDPDPKPRPIPFWPGDTRISRREKEPDPCEIGPYSAMQRKCSARGGQAHHIVPDYTLRTGPRPVLYAVDSTRLPNAPSLAQGMAICLTGQARVQGGEHHAAHASTDAKIQRAGMANVALPGTASWEDIRRAALDGIEAAKPDCLPAATAAIDAQFASMPGDQALRAVMDYRALPQATRDALLAGQRL